MGKVSHNYALYPTGKNSLANWEQIPIIAPMEQLISEVEAYCVVTGSTPQWVLRAAIGASWGQWDSWKAGKSSPTLRVADKLRAWMAAHPPQEREVAG